MTKLTRIEEVKKILAQPIFALNSKGSLLEVKLTDETKRVISSQICQQFSVPEVEVDVLEKREAGWQRLNTAALAKEEK